MSTKSNVVKLESKKLSSDQAVRILKENNYDAESHSDKVRKSFDALVAKGFRPLPLQSGLKQPVGDKWQKRAPASRDDFTGYYNIGIFTGEVGGNIVDVDKDDEDVTLEEIEHFFPHTPYQFGRYYGKDDLTISHFLYRVSDPGKLVTNARKPVANAFGKYPAVEVRCDGGQTMAPGSTIVDDKRGYIVDSVRWKGNSLAPPKEPVPETTRAHLIKCASVMMVSKYCAEYFKPGAFHNEMNWWCGFLISSGVSDELVEKSVRYIVEKTGQEDIEDRLASIKTTRKQVEIGEKVAGIGYLKDSAHWSRSILRWAAKLLNADHKDLEDDRPTVRIVSSREPQWLDLTLDAMKQTGKFYQQAGQTVIVTKQDNKAHVTILDKTVAASSWLTREVRFTQGGLDKSTGVMSDEDIKCPVSLAQEIADASTYKGHLSHLRGVSNTPVITPRGRIVDGAWEYDEELRLFFSSEFPFTRMYPDEALPVLNELLGDFPFQSERYRAAALGGILTAVVRPVLDICPLTVITSSQYSDGKSVLSGVIAAAVGVEASLGQLTRSGNDEEQEKQLSAILSRGKRVVTLDNHDGDFKSPALTEALTSTHPEFRVLGKNETRSVPNVSMFILNGVNTVPAQDLQTRSVFIRLARTSIDPNRKFKYPDILGYTYDNRSSVVGAALSLVEHAMTSEVTGWEPNHRFKLWDAMVRRTVMHFTGEDIAPAAIYDADRVMDHLEEVKHQFMPWLLGKWLAGVRSPGKKTYFRAKDMAQEVYENSDEDGWIGVLSNRRNHPIDQKMGRSLRLVSGVPFESEGKVWVLKSGNRDGMSGYWFEEISE